ncbi:MAG: IclR family transcriptional regulator domain-containing protein, partial [Canibacter sp.]
ERRSQSNFEALKHELDIIARTKISQSAAEVDEGIFAVAAPIYNGGRVIAVLSIAGLDFRLADSDRVRVKELVKVGAVEVSESLAEAIE